jgi:hypothetical protein
MEYSISVHATQPFDRRKNRTRISGKWLDKSNGAHGINAGITPVRINLALRFKPGDEMD